jgi:hypothetical protein
MTQHRLQHLPLAGEVVVGVGEDGREAEPVEAVLDADGELGKERVLQVGHDHADEIGAGGTQVGGGAVVDVADVLHGLAHLVGGFRLDAVGTAQDERDGRARNARLTGNVQHGRSCAQRHQ